MLNTLHIGRYNYLLYLFGAISILNLLAVGFDILLLNYFTKPLLISLLGIWFYRKTSESNLVAARYFLMGMVFSIIGDTLLMFVGIKGENFFLLGLGSFLMAHLCYLLAFIKFPKPNYGAVWQDKWKIIPFILVLISIILFLKDSLGAFLIPVTLYACTIVSMSVFCYNMKNRIELNVFSALFSGASLFVLSDLVIALVKFKYPAYNGAESGLIIMTTYLLGQFLLANNMASAINYNQQTRQNGM